MKNDQSQSKKYSQLENPLMKLALMQPYFFPYIGYFQLIHAVETFIIYDTVNYIKNGWIKRNRYLLNGTIKYLSLSVSEASSHKLITDTYISDEERLHSKERISKTIQMAYSKAPRFNRIFPLLNTLILNEEQSIANYNTYILRELCSYLDVETEILQGSEVLTESPLTGQDRVIEICKTFKADHYINPIGGLDLYDRKSFNSQDIKLTFLKTSDGIRYRQWDDNFFPNLSIIDVLMFNSKQEIATLLDKYRLISQ